MTKVIHQWLLAFFIVSECVVPNQSSKSKVFLLVFDGFVHNYEKFSSNMPNFQKLSDEGVKGEGLIPPFPSVTFPSMNTLSTGLYPESHGIINNDFFDEKGTTMFHWTGNVTDYAHNSRFFSQEPIWLSNQLESGSSSVYYWPGYYSFSIKPKYHNKVLTPFGADIKKGRQAIDETFENLKLDPSLNFMVVYIDSPDDDGHKYGVDSTEYKEKMEALDKHILGYLMQKLEPYPDINLVVVADHGMVNLKNLDHHYYVSDYLANGTYFGDPHCSSVCSIKPKNGHTAKELTARLKPLLSTGKFRIFNKIPPYLHYTHHKLIPPILILPNPGWLLYDNRPMNLTALGRKQKGGTHGYDPTTCIEMRTIFLARGPAFKRNVTMKPFESVNIYPLLAHLMGIIGRPNNGSLSTFSNVLVDWNPVGKINFHEHEVDDEHKSYDKPYAAYIIIAFVVIMLLCLVVMAALYFLFMRCYYLLCLRRVKYGKINYRSGFD